MPNVLLTGLCLYVWAAAISSPTNPSSVIRHPSSLYCSKQSNCKHNQSLSKYKIYACFVVIVIVCLQTNITRPFLFPPLVFPPLLIFVDLPRVKDRLYRVPFAAAALL